MRGLCLLHRTSSVSSSVWTSRLHVQHKGLLGGGRAALPLSRRKKVHENSWQPSGISCITMAAVSRDRCVKEGISLWEETVHLWRSQEDDVVIKKTSVKTIDGSDWCEGLYLCGSGDCVRGFHFCSPPPCQEKTKTKTWSVSERRMRWIHDYSRGVFPPS